MQLKREIKVRDHGHHHTKDDSDITDEPYSNHQKLRHVFVLLQWHIVSKLDKIDIAVQNMDSKLTDML